MTLCSHELTVRGEVVRKFLVSRFQAKRSEMHRALVLFSACVAMASAFAPSLPAGGAIQRTSAVSGEPSNRRVERACGAAVHPADGRELQQRRRRDERAGSRAAGSGCGRRICVSIGPAQPAGCAGPHAGWRVAHGQKRALVVGRHKSADRQRTPAFCHAAAHAHRRSGTLQADAVCMHVPVPRTSQLWARLRLSSAAGVHASWLGRGCMRAAPVTSELRGQA